MSSTEGLRELTSELTSLLSESSIKLGPAQTRGDTGPHGDNIPILTLPTLLPPSTQNEGIKDTSSLSSGTRGQSSIPPEEKLPPLPNMSVGDSIATTISTPASYSQTSLKTNQLLINQGLEQTPPLTRPIFSNGVSGSNLSSVLSSRSPSVQSSLSNFQEGLEWEGKTSTSNGQIKAHSQTIDILVNEKSSLQLEVASLQTQLDAKTRECTEAHIQLRESTSKIEGLKREQTVLSEELSRVNKSLHQLRSDETRSSDGLSKMRSMLEDQQQENTELISKITSQAAELAKLKNVNTELQSKLNMAELLKQQLSSGSQSMAPGPDPALAKRLKELESESTRLHGNVHQLTLERNQLNSDLNALRESLGAHQEQHSSELSAAQDELAEKLLIVDSITERLEMVERENDNLKGRLTTQHAQLEQSSRVALETAQAEKNDLENKIESLSKENEKFLKQAEDRETKILELEIEIARIKEQSVDQQSLLATIAQDKEAVSRAMSQNKGLKADIAELQDAFVKLSQQNMELASDLETERLRVAQLKTRPQPEQGTPPEDQVDLGDSPPPTQGTSPEDQVDSRMEALASELENQLASSNKQIEVLTAEKTDLHNQLLEVEASYSNLSMQLNQLKTEHAQLSDHYDQLQTSHSTLTHEHETLVDHTQQQAAAHNSTDFPVVPVDPNMSADEVTSLQQNFSALQQKFVHLFSEKVELLEKLQENEHLIVQLSHETETIGDYVMLYQAQRDSLNRRFKEKDRCIEELTQEKTAIQDKLRELQALVRQVLSNQGNSFAKAPSLSARHTLTPHTSTPSQPPKHSQSTAGLPLHLQTQAINYIDPLTDTSSDKSSVGTPETGHMAEGISHMTFGESQVTVDGDSFVSTATTEQILHLLDELDVDSKQRISVKCRVCVGPVLYV